MMKFKPLEDAIDRLQLIKWGEGEYEHRISNLYLLKEYLRRATLWSKRIASPAALPFYDIPFYIAPSTRVEKELVEIKILKRYLTPLMFNICEWYLHWTLISETSSVRVYNLPEPYEPLIKLFERGGALSIENGYIDVGSASIYFLSDFWKNYDRDEVFVNLDTSELDIIDSKYNS
jgi:hypothetical protein